MTSSPTTSPPRSRSSSTSSTKAGRKTPLSLDLSTLPPLIQPSPPSNTLLITVRPALPPPSPPPKLTPPTQNLQDPQIFHPANLLTIRDLINTEAPIHTWSPLKSFRRIIVSFHDVESAIHIRSLLDNQPIMGDSGDVTHLARIYFGEPTPINPTDQHLHLPKSAKLFFISPPPSPPCGWEMRNEGPPNKEVHPEDLATALARLHARPSGNDEPSSPVSPTANDEHDGIVEDPNTDAAAAAAAARRQRSGSTTMIYHPHDHGDSPHLPTIAVVDTTGEADPSPIPSPGGGLESGDQEQPFRTARPPVELMTE
ncbi:MAG: hypothetical protein M1819_001120 [Sarea resinae]|nr:MAG: hypothetical protein M1819_001120 [Sarea resinae]